MREVDVNDLLVAAVEKRLRAPGRVVDQLVRQHEVARHARADAADRSHRQDGARALRLQRPQIRTIVDAVRRYRVAMPVPREEDRTVPGDLAEHERRRRLAVRRANRLAGA